MGKITKQETDERALKKIAICREAGLEISQNFITGVTVAAHEGIEVLRAIRRGDNQWTLEYNDLFWDERQTAG